MWLKKMFYKKRKQDEANYAYLRCLTFLFNNIKIG